MKGMKHASTRNRNMGSSHAVTNWYDDLISLSQLNYRLIESKLPVSPDQKQ
jgi:hypothetical protein